MKGTQALVGLAVGTVACLVGLIGAGVAGAGDPEAGRAVFADKQCALCHKPSMEKGNAPTLEEVRRPQGEVELAGRLWNHVPAMLAAQGREGVQWPRFTPVEMSNLMAYLQADPARDVTPDPGKGQVALMRKGCLKCHSLRGEGGRVQPDLAERHADYESATSWAAAMWTHTPRMLTMAIGQGIPYPRFSGDEMSNLLGFLKSASGEAGGRPPGR